MPGETANPRIESRRPDAAPFFSICIPQHNRTSFIIEACRSLAIQTFKDFEVCISDDCSTDGRQEELIDYLRRSGLSFVYERQRTNRRYDANLRASMDLAAGRYCFLLGNDDRLASEAVLSDLHALLERLGPAGAVITNFEECADAKPFRRISGTGVLGAGPDTAAAHFRNYSFVSGIILDAEKSREFRTTEWDGSEMYQMFLGSRIVSSGSALIGFDKIAIQRNIQIADEKVDSYLRPKDPDPVSIREIKLPLNDLGRLVADAVLPYVPPAKKQKMIRKIFFQIFLFTYAFWIFEYRRIRSWKYACGVCIGMRPASILRGVEVSAFSRLLLDFVYTLVTATGWLIPPFLFFGLQPVLYSMAKRTKRFPS